MRKAIVLGFVIVSCNREYPLDPAQLPVPSGGRPFPATVCELTARSKVVVRAAGGTVAGAQNVSYSGFGTFPQTVVTTTVTDVLKGSVGKGRASIFLHGGVHSDGSAFPGDISAVLNGAEAIWFCDERDGRIGPFPSGVFSRSASDGLFRNDGAYRDGLSERDLLAEITASIGKAPPGCPKSPAQLEWEQLPYRAPPVPSGAAPTIVTCSGTPDGGCSADAGIL